LLLATGNLTGTCGGGAHDLRPAHWRPPGAIRGPRACLLRMGVWTADGLFL